MSRLIPWKRVLSLYDMEIHRPGFFLGKFIPVEPNCLIAKAFLGDIKDYTGVLRSPPFSYLGRA